MNVDNRNIAILSNNFNELDVFPRLRMLTKRTFRFDFDFGLKHLPEESGVILVRGPRQFGKSTWLEQQAVLSARKFGAGSTAYINADEVATERDLMERISELVSAFSPQAKQHRLFIDEITNVRKWEHALKVLADRGTLENVLVVTTGSKATDLRRGTERLPGRKGRLARTHYYFTPVSYAEFERHCGEILGSRTLHAYLLSGGSPLACNELVENGILPEYVITLTRDWMLGEVALAQRQRAIALSVLEQVHRYGGSPLGYTKLARETGIANNTVASGYIELFADLMVVAPAFCWDVSRRALLRRKPCKFHFINTLAALSFAPSMIRSVDHFNALSSEDQGIWYEWIVAQELWRRAVLRNEEIPECFGYWAAKDHEIDFMDPVFGYVEVKRGSAFALEFSWFAKVFGNQPLTVICTTPFSARSIRGVTLETFLREDPGKNRAVR